MDCAHEHLVEFDHFKIRPNQAFDHFHRFTIDKSRSDSSRQRFGEQSVRSDYQRILNSLKAEEDAQKILNMGFSRSLLGFIFHFLVLC